MVVVDFLQKGKRKINLAYFDHDTAHSRNAQNFVEEFASKQNMDLVIGKIKGTKGRRSMEEFWRDERYKFLERSKSKFVITCHHLDDVVETWVMSALHGKCKLIPYARSGKIYRPFLMTERRSIEKYAKEKNVQWIEDPSNKEVNYVRNHVRHNLMPMALKVNPGLRTTIRKKLIEIYQKM